MLKKIALVGPESSGKSSLCGSLANWFRSPKVDEVARDYLNGLSGPYQKEDVENIARLQLNTEKEMENHHPNWLFCDTNLLVIKIWMEHAYGNCPEWILEHLKKYRYNLTLLLKPDLGWMPDPLREHPDKQMYFFDLYVAELQKLGCRWETVEGLGDDRLKNALGLIHKNFPTEFPVSK
jgi:nicotinamide riboside kinase